MDRTFQDMGFYKKVGRVSGKLTLPKISGFGYPNICRANACLDINIIIGLTFKY